MPSFIFKTVSTLTTASASSVLLIKEGIRAASPGGSELGHPRIDDVLHRNLIALTSISHNIKANIIRRESTGKKWPRHAHQQRHYFAPAA